METTKKTITANFITNETTLSEVAQNLLDNWKVPKEEMEIELKTSEVRGIGFFDLIAIDMPYRTSLAKNQSTLPLYGSALYGSAIYPKISGSLKIRKSKSFKVVGVTENPKSLTTTLKIRQTGVTLNDGFFNQISTFYGSAIYGQSVYKLDSDRTNPNEFSVYGAAIYGTVKYGN